MSTIILALALLLLFYGEHAHCATVPKMNSTDMLSLLQFKQVLGDPKGYFSSWNSSVDYCNWMGITCGGTRHPRRVTVLDLSSQSLGGQIPPSLGNLTFLREIDLSNNTFIGQLPDLNRLHRLEILFLNNNQLQGQFPPSLGNLTFLREINLSSNTFIGQLPGLNRLNRLQYLDLNNNQLQGLAPDALRNCSNLFYLDLSTNMFVGSIPPQIGFLSKLNSLSLCENSLSGAIPPTILNHSSLQVLDVHSNFLRMELPSTIGTTLPRIVWLSLYNNTFHGQIPASLGNALNLSFIYLQSNSFTGHIPSSLGKLSLLRVLILDKNKLEANESKGWEFLDTLGNCTSLVTLSLSENQLQGSIPNSIGKLSSSLQFLGLGTNNLSGTVPESIGNLRSLTTLDLSENNLTGPIESWVGKLKNLGQLDLSHNNFSGPIPSSFANFTQLNELYLQSNKFERPIPPGLGKLQVLNFSYNNLQGSIPKDLFVTKSAMTICILSYNNLEGPIPPEVKNLQLIITELHLSSNKLVGEIPASLGECSMLLKLQLDSNSLSGNIPGSLGKLKSLKTLNLSHNDLSGLIPRELGSLSSLIELDLSYNDLQGQIPRDGVFGNATAVSLIGNRGLCGGVLDLHLPSCPTDSRRKKAQYYLIRVLIPIFGFMSVLMLIYFVLTEKKNTQAPTLSPLGDQFPIVSYNDLAQATQNFSESNLIGRGSCGSVYKGNLKKNKEEVAIKVLDLDMRGAEKSFLSECEALRNIRHRNLVPIITACSTVDINGNLFKALIYEFMSNGNLDSWLHPKVDGKARKPLGLYQRTCLAVNIADVLDYLHHETGRTIIHCDVKPCNILLDNDMNARLGDFGIANFYLDSRSTSTGDSNTVKGTIGYIAPEYARGGHASTYGDVYSFGIVLLEMLTGKRPTDQLFVGEQNIVSFVESNFPDKILHVIDAPLQEEVKSTQVDMATENRAYQCLFSLLQVALSCTRQYPGERTTMREAASRINAIKTLYVEGEHKLASVK